ncbi:14053_t:CDS:1, partial [Cetraspora pellucida]
KYRLRSKKAKKKNWKYKKDTRADIKCGKHIRPNTRKTIKIKDCLDS